jgi:6,7-dimethyl-8-ribityllumazine synthase
VENLAQATVRANADGQNKGGDAAAAALHLISLARKWGAKSRDVGFVPLGEDIQIAGDFDGSGSA